jgi:hypothetical protein
MAFEQDTEFGILKPPQDHSKLKLDFGSKFGLGGLGIDDLNSYYLDVAGTGISGVNMDKIESSPGLRMGVLPVDVDMDSKSALDRLMDDVAGGKLEDVSILTEEDSYTDPISPESPKPKIMQRAATDSAVIVTGHGMGITSRSVSGSSTISVPAPPVPPKDNIRSREAMIIERRREMRRFEDEGTDMFFGASSSGHLAAGGRPSRRRSMSTGDAPNLQRGSTLPDIVAQKGRDPDNDALADSIEKELQKLGAPAPKSVRDRPHPYNDILT